MNGFRFTTENGTVYEINRDAMTWRKVSVTDQSGTTRGTSGHLVEAPQVVVGEPARLWDDDVLPGCSAHCVRTSLVVSISEFIT